jgi:hypothetical protein
MFGAALGWAQGNERAIEMELVLKVLLVGYVLYAVLGAPMLAQPREHA